MSRWILLCVVLIGSSVRAAEPLAPPLTGAQQAAVDSITQATVLERVAFLASDEMAGRDTPSPELTMASAWVASVFRGAGLEGLGPDGSFFQTHDFPLTAAPRRAVLTTSAGTAIPVLGVLCGRPEATELSAPVMSETQEQTQNASRIVLRGEPDLPHGLLQKPEFVLAVLTRAYRELADLSTEVVLIACDDDSHLPELAVRLQQMVPNVRQRQAPFAVVLVEKNAVAAGQELTVQVDAQRSETVPVRNVVAVLRGSDPQLAKQAVLVSAHLDHIGLASEGADRINNGADDNATGVTTVLSLAQAFARLPQRPARSVIFATFWGEEQGLLGSRDFVKHPSWPLDQIVANINIEMVGRPETDAREKAWMTGWSHSNLGPLMNAGAQRVGVEIFNRTDVGEMLYSRSDNYSFVKQGVVAHSFSAGSLHSDYHQPSDEWEKLDLEHMTKVIQGLFAGVLYLADGDVQIRSVKADSE